MGLELVLLFKMFRIVNFIYGKLDVRLDGHSILVTPDPVPNSEVKLGMFVLVLSLMGTCGAVYFYFLIDCNMP